MENHEKSCVNYLVSIVRGAAVPSIVKLICHIRAYMLFICKQLCCRESVSQVAGGTLGRWQHCQRWRLAVGGGFF